MARHRYTYIAGFTVIELIVSAGIISIIMAVVMFNTRNFNDSIALKTSAQNVTLLLRQAQTYGTSVRETGSGTGTFTSGYGVIFDQNNSSSVFLFADNNANNQFDGSTLCPGNDECQEAVPLRNGVTVTDICGSTGGSLICFGSSMRSMIISYLRPNSDARITFFTPAGSADPRTFDYAYAVLRSPQGKTVKVYVNTSGQISVQ